jgi:hypothetical protein
MKTYKFYWLDGTVNQGQGETAEDAFSRLGFGAGAVRALDYHEEIKTEENPDAH